MMRKHLKIVAEFGNEKNKALLIRVPEGIAQDLHIDQEGNIHTIDFLKLLYDCHCESNNNSDCMPLLSEIN